MAFARSLPVLFQVVGPLVALVIVLAAGRGKSKTFGAIGAGLLLLTSLASGLLSIYLPLLMQRAGLSAASVGLLYLPLNLIGLAGLILLAVAVVTGRRGQDAPPTYPPTMR